MKKKISLTLFWVFCLLITCTPANVIKAATGLIKNGTNFSGVQAHGGCIIKVGHTYYWYGENRDTNNLFNSVRVYSSNNLVNWTDRGDALSKTSATELNACNIERPKVMYNARTKEYVMWMHYENGKDYSWARAAVAYSKNPTGPFTYISSFRPNNNMSRDCTTFVDTDGSGYFMSAANENADMIIYKLTPDYKSIESQVVTLWPGQKREAPCMFKRNGIYYLATSGCTGWSPNQQKYAASSSIASGWSELKNVGNENCYHTQGAYIFKAGCDYVFLTDRWAGAWGGKVNDSSYLMFPLKFSGKSLSFNFSDQVKANMLTQTVSNDFHTFTFEGVLTNRDPYNWVVSQPSSTDLQVNKVDGDKALCLSDSTESNLCSAYKDIPAKKGIVRMEFSAKFSNLGKWDRIQFCKGDTTGIDLVNFDGEEGFGYLTSDSKKNSLKTLSADTWYQFKIIANTLTKSFDFYVNNELVKFRCKFTGDVDQFDRIAFKTASGHKSNAYYDDIMIR